jgi:hypothetical protein
MPKERVKVLMRNFKIIMISIITYSPLALTMEQKQEEAFVHPKDALYLLYTAQVTKDTLSPFLKITDLQEVNRELINKLGDTTEIRITQSLWESNKNNKRVFTRKTDLDFPYGMVWTNLRTSKKFSQEEVMEFLATLDLYYKERGMIFLLSSEGNKLLAEYIKKKNSEIEALRKREKDIQEKEKLVQKKIEMLKEQLASLQVNIHSQMPQSEGSLQNQ